MSYTVTLSAEAEASLDALPSRIAAAALNFMRGDLAAQPDGVGIKLRGPLDGHLVARRGQYRIVYRIDADSKTVFVVHVVQN